MIENILSGREVIFEFFPVGRTYVKVSAMDVLTFTEISIQCPANAAQNLMKRNALKRLEYVLKKQGLIK